MITEEEVLEKVNDIYAILVQFRGDYQKQKPFRDELAQYLHSAYRENPELIVELFWRDFEGKIDRSNHPAPYCVHLFSAITETPNSLGIELACQLMIHEDHSYQEDSARFLYEAKDPVAVPFLIEGLNSHDYGVVRESALALGNIGDLRAESYLLELVTKYDSEEAYSEGRLDDAFPIIRASAFTALCLLNSTAANEKIIESVFGDRDNGIQQRALRHLIIDKPDVAMPYIEELMITQPETISHLIDSNPDATIPYWEVLAKSEDPDLALLASKHLELAHKKREERVNLTIESIHNIVNSMPEEAISILEKYSSDANVRIASLAQEMLSRLQ
jgi:HEAT repeat protein